MNKSRTDPMIPLNKESPRGHTPERFLFSDIRYHTSSLHGRVWRSLFESVALQCESIFLLTSYIEKGPWPMHDVVVSAVIAAVAAATITFNSTSQNREFFIPS